MICSRWGTQSNNVLSLHKMSPQTVVVRIICDFALRVSLSHRYGTDDLICLRNQGLTPAMWYTTPESTRYVYLMG
jgi:hypothetical protein